MQENAVQSAPLVDGEGRVVDVVTLQELLPQPSAPVHAVIMAGGFGRRLLPFTEDLPKPMLSVDGRPLLERIVDQLRDSGIEQINVTTHFKPEKIVDHFGDGQAFGVDITYVNEDRPLGTGGALGLMPVPEETTLVINGDVLTRVDFRTMLMYHRSHQADMTVAVSQYGIAVPYGVVECEGPAICRLREKPQVNFLVNAGIPSRAVRVWVRRQRRTAPDDRPHHQAPRRGPLSHQLPHLRAVARHRAAQDYAQAQTLLAKPDDAS